MSESLLSRPSMSCSGAPPSLTPHPCILTLHPGALNRQAICVMVRYGRPETSGVSLNPRTCSPSQRLSHPLATSPARPCQAAFIRRHVPIHACRPACLPACHYIHAYTGQGHAAPHHPKPAGRTKGCSDKDASRVCAPRPSRCIYVPLLFIFFFTTA